MFLGAYPRRSITTNPQFFQTLIFMKGVFLERFTVKYTETNPERKLQSIILKLLQMIVNARDISFHFMCKWSNPNTVGIHMSPVWREDFESTRPLFFPVLFCSQVTQTCVVIVLKAAVPVPVFAQKSLLTYFQTLTKAGLLFWILLYTRSLADKLVTVWAFMR